MNCETLESRRWLAVKVGAALTTLMPLIGGTLLFLWAMTQQRARVAGDFSFAGVFMIFAAILMATALPYALAWMGIAGRQRWAVWLLGVAALLQGSYEAINLVRTFARARMIYSHVTLMNASMFLVLTAHVLLLALTVAAAARLLAATRIDRRRGFPVAVAST